MHVSTGFFAKRDAAADGKGKESISRRRTKLWCFTARCKRHKAGSAVPACNVMRASGKRDCGTAQSGCGSCSGTNYNLPGARDGRARRDGKGAKKLCGLQRSSVRAAHMRDGPGIKRAEFVMEMEASAISGVWAKFARRGNDLPVYGFQALRHSFASKATLTGVPKEYLVKLMGHSSSCWIRFAYVQNGKSALRADNSQTGHATFGC